MVTESPPSSALPPPPLSPPSSPLSPPSSLSLFFVLFFLYLLTFLLEFMKAALRGISVIVSSGDFGTEFLFPNYTFPPYSPDYPATSINPSSSSLPLPFPLSLSLPLPLPLPYIDILTGIYVTSVGGTALQSASTEASCYTVREAKQTKEEEGEEGRRRR